MKRVRALSGPTARPPPYRAIGYIPIAPMFLRYRRVSRYTPPNFALSRPRGGVGRYRSSSCSLESIALYGGIAEIVSPLAV